MPRPSRWRRPGPGPSVRRTSANDGLDPLGLLAVEDAVDLAPGVGHEQVVEAVGVVVGLGHAHARAGVGHAGAGGQLLEAEADALGVGRRAARPRHVVVEPVGPGVVGHEQVEVAVALQVGEHRAEAVLEVGDLQARHLAHLAEGDLAAVARALVQVEQVPHARCRCWGSPAWPPAPGCRCWRSRRRTGRASRCRPRRPRPRPRTSRAPAPPRPRCPRGTGRRPRSTAAPPRRRP